MNLEEIREGMATVGLLPHELQALALACYAMSGTATLLDGDHYDTLGALFEAMALAATLSEGKETTGTTLTGLRAAALATAAAPVAAWNPSTAWHLTRHVGPRAPEQGRGQDEPPARGGV